MWVRQSSVLAGTVPPWWGGVQGETVPGPPRTQRGRAHALQAQGKWKVPSAQGVRNKVPALPETVQHYSPETAPDAGKSLICNSSRLAYGQNRLVGID